MRRLLCLICILMMSFIHIQAENVTYGGQADGIIFSPGSEYSLTDLFTEFKDVMPGDVLTQQITVRNNAKNGVKVKIYLRSLGAHDDSVDFLSKLHMSVSLSSENEMSYMFDASADKTDGLSDWVYLGTLYSGGEVNLDVNLHVPVELSNEYMNSIGYLDWEFMIEELPVEDSDPVPPNTGDDSNFIKYCLMMSASGLLLILLFVMKRKSEKEE